MEILFLVLSILGAIGGVIWLREKLARWIAILFSRLRQRQEQANFFYRELEISARISDKGAKWQTCRRATVFLKKPSNHIICGIGIPDKIRDSISIVPTDMHLESYNDHFSKLTKYRIIFPRVVESMEGVKWEIKCDFEKSPPSHEMLYWISSLRVDSLTLRAVFVDQKPTVRWRVTDSSDFVLVDEIVQVDSLTGEVRKTTTAPRPNLQYALIWENQQNGKRLDN